MADKTDNADKPEKPGSSQEAALKAAPATLASIDDTFFDAVTSGDEIRAESAAMADGIITNAEAALLVMARTEAEEKYYAEKLAEEEAARTTTPTFIDDVGSSFMIPQQTTLGFAAEVIAVGMVGNFYQDAFGGQYDKFGYAYADGSYQTVGGEFFDADANTIRLQDGQEIEVDASLAGHGADVLRMAAHIAEILDVLKEESLDVLEGLTDIAMPAEQVAAGLSSFMSPAKASDTASPAEKDFAGLVAAVGSVAVPVALAASAAFVAAAAGGPAGALAHLALRRALSATEVCTAQECMRDHAAKGHDLKDFSAAQRAEIVQKTWKALQAEQKAPKAEVSAKKEAPKNKVSEKKKRRRSQGLRL